MPWSREAVKPAYCCNKETFKYFREQRGWTQAELARVAGYSERLISKAESGRSVSSKTISDIADALSTFANPVFPEDLIADPVDYAKKFVEGLYVYQGQMLEFISPFLANDVEFRVAGDPTIIPFAGSYHGLEGAQRMISLFYSVMQAPADHDFLSHFQFIGQGNDVVVWGESWLHPIGQPLTKPMPMTLFLRFRRGKLYYLEDRFDTEFAKALIAGYRPV